MTVLIVGGAGYIGSHVNKWLNKKGIQTVVLDNLSRGNLQAVKWGRFYKGDCGDRATLQRVFKENPIDVVMHFAAYAYVRESVAEPAPYYENNVVKTLVLLDETIAAGVLNFIFSSGCATFGEAHHIPIDENHPQNPINPYGRTELIAEGILKDYGKAYGLRSCIFRYFNAAGCDPDGEIGESHEPETHLIPLVIKNLIGKIDDISVFGNDYQTDDGTCVRDYIHVNDLAEAHRLGAEFLLREGRSETFNLGNGKGFSVTEVIRTAEKVTGQVASIRYEPRRPGDPPVLVGSAEKAKRILGWRPRYLDIADILRTAWLWELKVSGILKKE